MSRPKSGLRFPSASACGQFRLLGNLAARDVKSPPEGEEWAVASNKPAAQPAVRRATVQPAGEIPDFSQAQEHHALSPDAPHPRFEEKAGQLYGRALIGGFCHLYIGQEAVVIGIQMAIKTGDEVIKPDTATMATICLRLDPKA